LTAQNSVRRWCSWNQLGSHFTDRRIVFIDDSLVGVSIAIVDPMSRIKRPHPLPPIAVVITGLWRRV